MTARDVPYRDRGERHPRWCDPARCTRVEDYEVVHESAVTTLRGIGWRINTYLHMADELRFNEPWRPVVVVELDEPDIAPHPVAVWLKPSEARALRDRLSEQLLRGDVAELCDPGYFTGGGERDE